MRDIIETDRLVLRPVALTDAEAFAALANDFDIAKMTGTFPYPFPQLSVEFKIMQLRSGRYNGTCYPYAVIHDGTFIGICSLHRKDRLPHLEIAYWIGRPFWGQGFAFEAAAALLQAAEQDLGTTAFSAGCFQDNPASDKVLKKLGFERTGTDEYFSVARFKKAPGFLYERPAALAS